MSGPAAAWIETTPKGLVSTLEIEPSGQATVTEELTLEVRGGPLRAFELPVADADAVPIGEATVKKLSGGPVLPVLVERRADGVLALEIDHDRGLRSGIYLFQLSYRTDFRAANVLTHRGGAVELSWVGPRLEAGVDAVRTVVRMPAADVPPRLPDAGPDDPENVFGVLVAAVRRTPAGDEIDLVRSHVARGEPALFRVEASARAFPSLVPKAAASSGGSPTAPRPGPVPTLRSPRLAWASGLVAAVLALLVLWKARAHRAACSREQARSRPLVRLPLWLRAPLAGASAGAALFVGAELELPALAGGFLLAAFALSALASPRAEVRPRGPGRWLPLSETDAFGGRGQKLPGAWLDSGCVRGFSLLLLSVALVLGIAARELGSSPYRALLVVLMGSLLVSIFFTGRASDLAGDRVAFSRAFLGRLLRGLRGRRALKAVPWARLPDGSSEPDELRVLVKPRDALEGLVALEVALEPQRGLGGVAAAPFVIVRAREGSRAERALPVGLRWTRGRKSEERVAILSPALPTLRLTLALVDGLVVRLSAQSERSARMSSGRSDVTSNLGRAVSPAHAT